MPDDWSPPAERTANALERIEEILRRMADALENIVTELQCDRLNAVIYDRKPDSSHPPVSQGSTEAATESKEGPNG